MVKHALTVALVKSVLQVLDRMGPTRARRRQRHPRRRGHRGRRHQQQQPGVTLDLDWLRWTRGDPKARSLHLPLADIPNPRVRVLEWPPSPSPDQPAYRPMAPSDPVVSPWGRQQPPCTVHGMGPCPYPVVQWQLVFSSLGDGEGEEEDDQATGEEEEDDVVVVTVVDKDDEPIKVIPVPESTPPRSPYKQMARIHIGPRGQPTRTLSPREGAREAGPDSLEAGSTMWPPPPPPPPSGPVTTTPPPPSSDD
jgi:hypothetical protein